jgi:prevent-host-death family protein
MRTMAAGEFKAKCLAVMDEVAATGEPVLVTKRGKPVARVVAPGEAELSRMDADALFGSLRHMGTIATDMVSSEFNDEAWERMAEERWAKAEADRSK